MATNILMPALSPTMTEGTLARWLKKEGEAIRAGDIIAEIETDKATMEVEAVDEGVLGKILVAEGTAGVKVNAPIAVLIAEGEAVPEGGGPSARPAPSAAPSPTAAPAPAAQATKPASSPAPQAEGAEARLFASPLARRMAQQAGIDLAKLKGSGPSGRIVKADIEAALQKPAAAPIAAAPTSPPAPAAPSASAIAAPHDLIAHSSMRKIIARRLSEAKQQIPHFYLSADIALDALSIFARHSTRKPRKTGLAPSSFRSTI